VVDMQTCSGDLILIVTRNLAQVIQCAVHMIIFKEIDRKCIACIDQFLCVTGITDIDGGYVFSPHDTDTAPTNSHGIGFAVCLCGHGCPFATDLLKRIKL